ncbi:hypothetical protein ACKZDW_16560 [Ralstonia syzygii subsp. celebesensis]|uniref:Uncharacterized protein n=2 Tax=Ralstonia syzygii subsp. celebesensis TaxID=1310168 RepID=A0A1U9VHH0_9RALS|nr:hypothetical protein [Ralstonia syzygii]AQW30139.1 hypothetical protein B0B51_09210 [blood disease bacterium A2-HR MARDI]QQV56035.1 hypothetical protein JK151_02980 [Ralstonia syzygii subsp. celebesensis]CCA80640.1 conserved hypothetical protein [blood disease bacterium R229]
MAYPDFAELDDLALADSALDEKLGFAQAKAIVALANRALKNPDLLDSACKAISSDRSVGFHRQAPLGWFGADHIYLSGQEQAMRALLAELDKWSPTEQEDLVRHWAGRRGIAAVTEELKALYGWNPRYGNQ